MTNTYHTKYMSEFWKTGIAMSGMVLIGMGALYPMIRDKEGKYEHYQGKGYTPEEYTKVEQGYKKKLMRDHQKQEFLKKYKSKSIDEASLELLDEVDYENYRDRFVSRPDYGDGRYNPNTGQGTGRPRALPGDTKEPIDMSEIQNAESPPPKS